jgi:putative hemolysin
MPTTVVKTIRTSGGDYTTLSAWEAAQQGDLVSADEIRVAECYNDWPSGLVDGVLIDGWTTDATRYPKITVAEGHRHSGSPQTGFFLKRSANTATVSFAGAGAAYTQIEWLDVENTSTGSAARGLSHSFGGTGIVLRNVIVKIASGKEAIHLPNGSKAIGCCAWGNSNAGSIGINASISLNCTVRGYGVGFYPTTGDKSCKNCVAYGAAYSDYYLVTAANCSNNASGDTSAPGVNSITGITSADFVDAANNDFHLASGSDLIGAGTNLYSTFTTDIDGDEWPSSGAWDIGFDYYVATGGATIVSTTQAGSWSVRNTVSTTQAAAFSVRNLAATTQPAAWSVRNAVATEQAGAWSVYNLASQTQAGAWTVQNLVATTQDGAFSVRNLADTTQAGSWSVRNLVSTSQESAWSVRNLAATTQDGSWAVRNLVSTTQAGAWSVEQEAGIVSVTQDGAWTVRNLVSTSQAGAFSVRSLVSTSQTGAWSVRNLAATTQAGAFSVRNLAATTQAGAWTVRNIVSATQAGAFSVQEAGVVSTTQAGSWSVRNLVSTSQSSAWTLRNFVTDTTQGGAWTVRGLASTSQAGSWSVFGFVDSYQDGAWSVVDVALASATQAGAWSVRNLASAYQAGAWRVGEIYPDLNRARMVEYDQRIRAIEYDRRIRAIEYDRRIRKV